MASLILLHKRIRGHFTQKITKTCFLGDSLLENSFFMAETHTRNVFNKMFMGLEHVALL